MVLRNLKVYTNRIFFFVLFYLLIRSLNGSTNEALILSGVLMIIFKLLIELVKITQNKKK